MDMRIPLETAAESVQNADKAGSKAFSFTELPKHIKDDVANGMKETVEQRTVSAEEDTKFFGNGKDTMTVNALDDFERHGRSALDRIEIATGRTETAFTAKRNKFERTTRRTPVHSAAERGISTMNHLLDIFKNNRAGFKGVLDFFEVI